jgi:L,D-transpeptidase catalytic domain
MMVRRLVLAIGFAIGCTLWIPPAFAQRADDPGAINALPGDAAPGDERVDRSQPAPAGHDGQRVIVNVDLSAQNMHVQFPDGTEETWLISSGRPGYDTPDGKYKPQWVDPDHVSKQYQDAPMPYAVFFDLKGHAFHGSYQKKFGVAQSHGCVRLPIEDAKKLYEAVRASGAEIEITGRAPRKGGTYEAQRREPPERYAGAPRDDGYGYGYGPDYGRSYPAYPPARAYPPPPQPQPFLGGLFGR